MGIGKDGVTDSSQRELEARSSERLQSSGVASFSTHSRRYPHAISQESLQPAHTRLGGRMPKY